MRHLLLLITVLLLLPVSYALQDFVAPLLTPTYDSLEIPTFEAENFGIEDGDIREKGGFITFLTNGKISARISFPESKSYEIKIIAKGKPANAAWPNMRVLLDGAIVKDVKVAASSPREFIVPAEVSSGVHTLSLEFTNEYFLRGRLERILYVDSVKIPSIPAVPAQLAQPAVPAIPATPAIPAVPKVSPAVPAIPATPAQPPEKTCPAIDPPKCPDGQTLKITTDNNSCKVFECISSVAAPDLAPTISPNIKAPKKYSIYIFTRNIGGADSGDYTLNVDYGDGSAEEKTFAQPIKKGKTVSQEFVHEYAASGTYEVTAVVSTEGEKNTNNNKAVRQINVRIATPATGKIVEKPSSIGGFLSRLIEMLS